MSEIPAQFIRDDRSPLRKALDASRSGRAIKLIEFDGSGGRLRGVPLALRTLTTEENIRVRADALRWLSAECGFTEDFLVGTTSGESITDLEVKVRTIALALVEPAPPNAPVAKDATEMRALLDADEIAALFEEYLEWVQERSPITTAKTAEEVASLVDALGKGTLPLQRLSGYDSVSLRSIVRELVHRWTRQMNSPSLPTSPQSDTATNSSDDSD